MNVKAKLARQAVRTTAKHTASRFTHKPYRSLTLLALGAVIGGIVGWLIGRSGGGDEAPESLAGVAEPTGVATSTDGAAEQGRGGGSRPMTGRPEERDEAFVEEEEAEAEKEAGAIGGRREPDTDDPARQPLIESGEGEAEGFELAERDLEDIAEHGDEHRFPDGMARPEEEQDLDEFGEPDEPIPRDESR